MRELKCRGQPRRLTDKGAEGLPLSEQTEPGRRADEAFPSPKATAARPEGGQSLSVAAGGGYYRSTSPMMGSIEEMLATASATMPPRSMWGRAWRFTNDGPRTWNRYGLALPSDTM